MNTIRKTTLPDGTVTLAFVRPDHKGKPTTTSVTFSPTAWQEFVVAIINDNVVSDATLAR